MDRKNSNIKYVRYSSTVTLVATPDLWKLLAWHVNRWCWWTRDRLRMTSLLLSACGNAWSSTVLDSIWPFDSHVMVGGGEPDGGVNGRILWAKTDGRESEIEWVSEIRTNRVQYDWFGFYFVCAIIQFDETDGGGSLQSSHVYVHQIINEWCFKSCQKHKRVAILPRTHVPYLFRVYVKRTQTHGHAPQTHTQTLAERCHTPRLIVSHCVRRRRADVATAWSTFVQRAATRSSFAEHTSIC